MSHKKTVIFAIFIITVFSCKNEKANDALNTENLLNKIAVSYAEGFSITDYGNYRVLEVKNPWPESPQVFRYALVKDENDFISEETYDAVIQVPVNNLIVTSTTHIPSLEMLNEVDKLIACTPITADHHPGKNREGQPADSTHQHNKFGRKTAGKIETDMVDQHQKTGYQLEHAPVPSTQEPTGSKLLRYFRDCLDITCSI